MRVLCFDRAENNIFVLKQGDNMQFLWDFYNNMPASDSNPMTTIVITAILLVIFIIATIWVFTGKSTSTYVPPKNILPVYANVLEIDLTEGDKIHVYINNWMPVADVPYIHGEWPNPADLLSYSFLPGTLGKATRAKSVMRDGTGYMITLYDPRNMQEALRRLNTQISRINREVQYQLKKAPFVDIDEVLHIF